VHSALMRLAHSVTGRSSVSSDRGEGTGEAERPGLMTWGVLLCLSAERRALPGAALEVLFDLAIAFRFAPAPRALVVQGAGRGVLRNVRAHILGSHGHTRAPPLHGPPEAASRGQQGTGGGDPWGQPQGRGLLDFDVIN
jgi:hypothetical protein